MPSLDGSSFAGTLHRLSAALCWAEPARLHAGLSFLAWPEAAAWLFSAGFASAALGVGLSLSLLGRGPAIGEDQEL